MERMDSVAIVEENQRKKQAERDAQAEHERQELEKQNRLNANKVPDMVRELLEELSILHGELVEESGPDLKGRPATIIEIPQPLPAQPKASLWKRVFGSNEPTPRTPHKKVAIWWGVAAAHTGDDWLHLHLGVDDGTVYGLLGIKHVSVDEARLTQLPYTVLQKLLADVKRERNSIRFDRKNRERDQRRLDEATTDAAGY